MAGNIFISYRRDDDPGFAHAIYQRLKQEFPGDILFMDVAGEIEPGDDFVAIIADQIERCDVLLAIIGKRWIGARDKDGNRRLDNDEDFVRIEIESALDAGKRVIPVLVNDAPMPRAADLPETLRELAPCSAVEIRSTRFEADCRDLIKGLKKALNDAERQRAGSSLFRRLVNVFKDMLGQPGQDGKGALADGKPAKPDLDQKLHPLALILFFGGIALGVLFVAVSIYKDVTDAGTPVNPTPFLLLFVALVIALAFEFVNGFHDTANAVATVIYTHALPPNTAVVWSGVFNFLGVLASSGAVAYSIVSLLPVELILQVGGTAGFTMVFALLIAAIIWNLGTWYFGLPASSSHTLIGSIIGIGIAHELMHGRDGTSGVDWSQAREVAKALFLSPLVGFAGAALLLIAVRSIVRIPALYAEPKGARPPPWWIRILLILTCTGVSYAHGSNDGQKGMGLLMLILIGTAPTAYALNRATPQAQIAEFQAASKAAAPVIQHQADGYAQNRDVIRDPRPLVIDYVSQRKIEAHTYLALSALVTEINGQVEKYGSLAAMPASSVTNTRNDMYLASEAIRFLLQDEESGLKQAEVDTLHRYRQSLDNATKFIPYWVKIAVAVALGLGTMLGWKRIVVTVGERIGKAHLTYAQGASAELVATVTIKAADIMYGMPVSTTHVLSSGIAGAMAATDSELQWVTVRNILLAWVLTQPAAITLSGTLYFLVSSGTAFLG